MRVEKSNTALSQDKLGCTISSVLYIQCTMYFNVLIQSNSFRRRNDFVQRRGKETDHRSSPSLRFTDDEKDFFQSTVYFPRGVDSDSGADDNYNLISFICCSKQQI